MCNISINFLSYTLPLEFLLYMQPLKVRGPASRITTPWWNGLLRQLSVSTRGVLEGGTKLVSHQFGFVGVIQIQVGQFTQVSTGIPDQVEATENGRLMSPCIFKEANGSAAPNCSIWYDYNFCTSVSQGFATFPLVEIYHEDQRKAIASIPAYILQCEFFVALCPDLRHHDSSSPLLAEKVCWCRSEDSWQENFQVGMMAMAWFFWSRVHRTCFLAFRLGKPC